MHNTLLFPCTLSAYISAPLLYFERWCAVTKTTTTSGINDAFCCYVLVGNALVHIGAYKA